MKNNSIKNKPYKYVRVYVPDWQSYIYYKQDRRTGIFYKLFVIKDNYRYQKLDKKDINLDQKGFRTCPSQNGIAALLYFNKPLRSINGTKVLETEVFETLDKEEMNKYIIITLLTY